MLTIIHKYKYLGTIIDKFNFNPNVTNVQGKGGGILDHTGIFLHLKRPISTLGVLQKFERVYPKMMYKQF